MTKALAFDVYATQSGPRRPFGAVFAKLRRRYAERRLKFGVRSYERKKYSRAFRHFLAAARGGHPQAQFRLARLYAESEGVFGNPGDAVYWYRQAARSGNVDAQFELSLAYLHGRSVRYTLWYQTAAIADGPIAEKNLDALFPNGIWVNQDYAEALYWGLRAAEQGRVEAQANVGLQYLQGLGCETNCQAALGWLEKAEAGGSTEACFGLGMAYANGLGVAIDFAAAAMWYEKAASQGHDGAEVALALMLVTGQGVERDAGRAALHFKASSERGNVRALHSLGLLCLNGDGVEQDFAQAESCFRRAARRGYIPAMMSLAEIYTQGRGAMPNVEDAVLWYGAAAELGNVEAQYNLGYLYSQGSASLRRPSVAAIWYTRAAEQGYPAAQFNLALCLLEGDGVARDPDLAVEWLRRAAEQDFAPAQLSLAGLYLAGEQLPSDHKSATRWLERAAANNEAEAQFELGVIHATGHGIPPDFAAAAGWYRLAAAQGHRFAQHNLADLLLAGDGVEADAAQAAIWFAKAAEQGLPDSQLALGDLLASGRGVARHPESARHWYEKAASQGLEDAAARLIDLATASIEPPAEPPAPAEPEATRVQAMLPTTEQQNSRRSGPGAVWGEPVRLVIWDLDETFWLGTLSEGGIRSYVQENHDIVIALARRGIMSSICSKNEPDAVREILERHGVWNYFIFPSIDWTAKARRVAAILEAVQLRATSVLFIDDNPMNRAEVAALVSGIQVADETILPGLLDDPRFKGKNDQDLTRLAQYKLLEKRNADQLSAGSDDEAFLRSSHIRVIIENDVAAHLDRAVELINRTNQLNFTKRRLPEDLDEARKQLQAQISPFYFRAALVRVIDDYGDYGYCGFYLMSDRLVDFCFSCRILGMGVESWLYERLGRPALTIVGEVLTDLSERRNIDWITLAETNEGDSERPAALIPEIRLRGGCDLDAVGHYFRLVANNIQLEGNRRRGPLIVRMDSSAQFLPSLGEPPPGFYPAVKQLGYAVDDFASEFLAPAAPGSVLIYSPLGDVYVMVYRHKAEGFAIPISVDLHEDLTRITDAALAEAFNRLKTTEARKEEIKKIVGLFRAEYTHEPRLPLQAAVEILRTMFKRIPDGARLFVVLPYEWIKTDNGLVPRPEAVEYNAALQELARGYRSVTLVPMNDLVSGGDDMPPGFDHFDRLVYFRMYERIMRELDATASRSPPEMGERRSKGPSRDAQTHLERIVSGEPVRLVIWGLDDILQPEGREEIDAGSAFQLFQDVTIALAQRGIISSICFKNDPDAVGKILDRRGISDYFIVPSSDRTAKGRRVAAIIEALQLRAANVLYIEDNPMNRAEVAACAPGIQIADVSILPQLLDDRRLEGKDDQSLVCFGRYKLLEKNNADRMAARGDGEAFLRASNIRIVIDIDVEAHLDRAIDLMNGMGEMNFTKRQLPAEIGEARKQLLDEIGPYYVNTGLIRVIDKYGDFGHCGFYRSVGSILIDYCFSPSVRGMGIETWLYERFGRPQINLADAVLTDFSEPGTVDWITAAAIAENGADQPIPPIPEIRLRGGGVIEAVAHRLRLAADTVRAETNLNHAPIFVHTESTAQLAPLLGEVPPRFYDAVGRLGYTREDFASDFLAPAPPGTVLLYSPWGDLSVPVYRHKTDGFVVPDSVDIYRDLTRITDEELSAALEPTEMPAEHRGRIAKIVAELSADYEYESQLPISMAVTLMRKLFERIPAGAHLFIVLPYEYIRWNDELIPRANAIDYNAAIRNVAREHSAVTLVEPSHAVAGPEDIQPASEHFERVVYFRIFQRIIAEIARIHATHGDVGRAKR